MGGAGPSRGSGAARSWRRWLPLAGLAAALVAVYLTGAYRYLSLATLHARHQELQDFVAAQPVAAPLLYIAVYAAAAALSLPGAVFLTLAGGLLFGTLAGSLYAVIGATLGAVTIFLIARTALGSSLRGRVGPRLQRMEAGFRENAWSYLLVLRLIPLFPFWLVNLVPAILGVPLRTFALATLVGIVPGCLVYASVGDGLGAVLERGQEPDLGLILEPRVLLPLLGLAALAMLPILYRHLRGGRADASPNRA